MQCCSCRVGILQELYYYKQEMLDTEPSAATVNFNTYLNNNFCMHTACKHDICIQFVALIRKYKHKHKLPAELSHLFYSMFLILPTIFFL